MPPIEIYAVLLTVVMAGWLTRRLTVPRWLRRAAAGLLVLVLVLQLVLMGPHWQMLPVDAAALVCLPLVLRRSTGRAGRALAALILVLAPATVIALWVIPMFRLPAPTGPFSVGTTGPVNWTDTSRNLRGDTSADGPRRELVVQIWYPVAKDWKYGKPARYARLRELGFLRSYQAQLRTNSLLDAPIADEGASFPVLVFGHRWDGARTQDTFLAEDLASHGYVVVAMDHPLNASRMLLADGSVVKSDRSNGLNEGSAQQIQALWNHELAIWVADDSFVLDELERNNAGWFRGRLDFSRVGAFGHSFGGAASLALLGRDPRVKCAINLDGWTFQGLDRRTTQPVLAVYEGSGQVRQAETGVDGELDRADWAAIDGSMAKYGGLRAFVAGTQHLDFTDQTLFSPFQRLTHTGPISGERIRTITRGLVLGFFDQNLRGTGEIPAYPEVSMERWPLAGR